MCSIRPSMRGLFSVTAISCTASTIFCSIFQPGAVELLAARRLHRLLGRHDAELLTLRAHHADLAGADALVDTDLLCLADKRLLDVRADGWAPRARSAETGPLGHERPTVRLGSRAVISRASSASTPSTAT